MACTKEFGSPIECKWLLVVLVPAAAFAVSESAERLSQKCQMCQM